MTLCQSPQGAIDWRACVFNLGNAGYWSDSLSQDSGSCWTSGCTPVTGNEVWSTSFSLTPYQNLALCPKDPSNCGDQVFNFTSNTSSLNITRINIPYQTVWWFKIQIKSSEVKQIELELGKYSEENIKKDYIYHQISKLCLTKKSIKSCFLLNKLLHNYSFCFSSDTHFYSYFWLD